jgi:hypothetical protein
MHGRRLLFILVAVVLPAALPGVVRLLIEDATDGGIRVSMLFEVSIRRLIWINKA